MLNDVARKIADDVDNFYFQALSTYGITRRNIHEFKDRLRFSITGSSPNGIVQLQEIYLDNVHVLTIEIKTEISDMYTDEISTKIKFNTHREVVWQKEEMK